MAMVSTSVAFVKGSESILAVGKMHSSQRWAPRQNP
jgi:hypothetical protein